MEKKERKKPERIDIWVFFGNYFKKTPIERKKEHDKMKYVINRVDFFNNDLSKIKFVRRS